jgi:hypothetical protein
MIKFFFLVRDIKRLDVFRSTLALVQNSLFIIQKGVKFQKDRLNF